MFGIGKISLGSSAHKRYNHNLSFDNNTTFDFGSVQPLMCQYMMPNSDVKVSYKQLVRLAPLVCPSFARVHLQNEASFVSIAEVVPYYEAMLARMPYSVGGKTYKPTQLPYTTSAFLVYLLFCNVYHSKWTFWQSSSSNHYTPCSVNASSLPDVVKRLKGAVLGDSAATAPSLILSDCVYSKNTYECIRFEGADYVIKFSDGTAITFRLSSVGRRIRKIFIGLGYSLNMTDLTPVSFVPLLAFYKAWFDLYAVQRDSSWINTSAFALIKHIEDYYFTNITPSGFAVTNVTLVLNFFNDLANCWYIYKDDFVSVHRTDMQLVDRSVKFRSALGVDFAVKSSTSASKIGDPYIPYGAASSDVSAVAFSNVALQTLQRLSRFVNKDSLIAQRMSQWLRVHFGADVANSLFKDVNHLSSSRLDLQINDVFSTSDTYDATTQQGEALGSYAGKGIGFAENGFKFHASTAGYIFVLSSIVPESGYFQGNDFSLYAIDNDSIPNADFDALGMELTPKGAIVSDNDILIEGSSEKLTDAGFGFIPRFSGFKVKKNIVNGDMSRRGSIDSLSPYYLDRILTSTTLDSSPGEVTSEDNSSYDVVDFHLANLPVASPQWRYCARYPWLGQYNRIFLKNVGDLNKGGSVDRDYDSSELVDDNFICQSLFTVSMTNCLKPISESYDTYEESTDKGTVDVIPE